jgi:hypothetical protein
LILALLLAAGPVRADEGMWVPWEMERHSERLVELGYEGSVDALRDPLGQVLGAVVSVNRGCTGSFVSERGLVATNHHCIGSVLQHNSSEEHNLLRDGWYAAGPDEELPAAPGYSLFLTESFEDITDRFDFVGNKKLRRGSSDADLHRKIERTRSEQVAACEAEADVYCSVATYDGGARYVLMRQREIKDVRLVYAPPDMVGNFGDEVDNWQWPRHSGDFALLRAYVGPAGESAEYHVDNRPFGPRHHLPVATRSMNEGEVVLVAGYPGRTDRNLLASEVRERSSWYYPQATALLRELLDVIEEQSAGRPEAVVRSSSKRQGMANSLKLMTGLADGLAAPGPLMAKDEVDRRLRSDRGTAKVVDGLETVLAEHRRHRERDLLLRYVGWASAPYGMANRLLKLAEQRSLPDAEREPGYQDRDLPRLAHRLEAMPRRYDPQVDAHLLGVFLRAMVELPEGQAPSELMAYLDSLGGGDRAAAVEAVVRAMEAGSIFDDATRRDALMTASLEELQSLDDPAFGLAAALRPVRRQLEESRRSLEGAEARLRPVLHEAQRRIRGDRYYPDANGTLRVTFGSVRGYQPRDAVRYAAVTQVRGIEEKHRGEFPFDAPRPLLEAIERAGSSGAPTPIVNFLSDVDTTGGNSGSPTLNGRGELCGLLFDGNYEALASEFVFDVELNRAIHVDIQYLIWTLKHVVGDQRLRVEMGVKELW